MNLSQVHADIFVPSKTPVAEALARTTHLCLAAHQDDIEIMAYHGIAECFASDERWFTGVVVTDGSGSPRAGRYANFSDEQMKAERRLEQRKAAKLGKFSAMLQLAHPSSLVKSAKEPRVRADIGAILEATAPHTVYLHNPADKHDTHIAVFLRCIEALRAMPKAKRPRQVYGCEVWRNLDWLLDEDKQVLDASANPKLAAKLVAVFQSQIAGGKRYDLATAGRRLANATFHTSHFTDKADALTWAMDLTPLVQNEKLSIEKFTLNYIDRLRADVAARLKKFN
ncbi:PIG-L deacetylase family protein [Oleiharenicola lentus]|uniref:PIG-L deacetylase family protein n=1 Tax=Oleiharenicola lentus TaxID=2508720 RepID=UPI003F67321E